MQIKTLAEILAENVNTEKSKKPSNKRDNQSQLSKSQHSKNQHFNSRVKKRFARDFGMENNPANFDSEHNLSETAKPYSKQTDAPLEFNETTNAKSYSSSVLKKRKKKKTFHPASPYQPKLLNQATCHPVHGDKATGINSVYEEIDPNKIKASLAQHSKEAELCKTVDTIKQTTDSVANDDNTNTSEPINSESNSSIDNLPSALKAYLKTPEQRHAEKEEIKANSRLRWLAFYYLSRREHSASELRQKLLDKDQDPVKIEQLLQEFADKGYQSDYRTALMIIREGIRKGRGRLRIKNDFYKRKVEVPSNIDELIDMAVEDNEEFVDVLSDNELIDGIDWLRLAVEARVKKYGNEIPTENKIKARQLRFLQYRGFKPDVCFQAITHNLQTLDNRF